MWIMIAGPFRQGSTDTELWEQNLSKLNEAAYLIFLKGHTPIIGVNLALPIIKIAGTAAYEQIMMPLSMALAEKCDAVLRLDGFSVGADEEVSLFESKGLPIYYEIDQIPSMNQQNQDEDGIL